MPAPFTCLRLFSGTALGQETCVYYRACLPWAQQFVRDQEEWAIWDGKGVIKGFPEVSSS